MALIMLLKAAKDRGIKSLRVYGDSKLVVSQISRQWKINLPISGSLRAKRGTCRGMDITYSWIPREENKRADMLSNEGIDGAK